MNSKHCPHCNCSTEIVKKGKTSSNRQRYYCKCCGRTWTNKARFRRLDAKIWNDFVWNNQVVRTLAEKYQKHPNTIRKIINSYAPPNINLSQLSSGEKAAIQVIVMDTTYFGRKHGVVSILDAHSGKLLYFQEIFKTETNSALSTSRRHAPWSRYTPQSLRSGW